MPQKALLKALTGAGIGSRRKMADAIKQGKVRVNGELAESFNHPVNIIKDRITINGQPVKLKTEDTICLMLHKPEGIVSTTSDEKGRQTVLDILPEKYRDLRLYPAGRLDKDTTGLLLLTNDGDLTYRLTHPRFEHEKEYLVHIKGRLNEEEIDSLRKGITLEDGLTSPADLKEERSSPPYNYSITVHEGRKRQVRRMFERLGHPVLSLKRIRIGSLDLGELKEGEARRLTKKEIEKLIK